MYNRSLYRRISLFIVLTFHPSKTRIFYEVSLTIYLRSKWTNDERYVGWMKKKKKCYLSMFTVRHEDGCVRFVYNKICNQTDKLVVIDWITEINYDSNAFVMVRNLQTVSFELASVRWAFEYLFFAYLEKHARENGRTLTRWLKLLSSRKTIPRVFPLCRSL